jgi:hypothetical protein
MRTFSEFISRWSGLGRQDAAERVHRESTFESSDELARYKTVIADAVRLLNQSRCAVKSQHVKEARTLLKTLL